MKKIISTWLCWIGLHQWTYEGFSDLEGYERHCEHCHKYEKLK